jgi:hypothetical protein
VRVAATTLSQPVLHRETNQRWIGKDLREGRIVVDERGTTEADTLENIEVQTDTAKIEQMSKGIAAWDEGRRPNPA